jgi:hypothetical protein
MARSAWGRRRTLVAGPEPTVHEERPGHGRRNEGESHGFVGFL